MHAILFFFSSRRRHTRSLCDWSSDVCSSDLGVATAEAMQRYPVRMIESGPAAGALMAAVYGELTGHRDRKSTRLNSSHTVISYAVFCLKKKKTRIRQSCANGKWHTLSRHSCQ